MEEMTPILPHTPASDEASSLSPDSSEDARLSILLSKGSEMAFAQLYHRHKDRVFSLALSFLRSREDAREVVQDTFSKVWVRRADFAQVRNAGSFIFIIGRNLAINMAQRKKNLRIVTEEYTLLNEGASNSTERAVFENENERVLAKSLSLLTPAQQKVFLMSRVDGLSHADIAKKMNISSSTVKQHIIGALERLRKHLRPHIGAIVLLALLF